MTFSNTITRREDFEITIILLSNFFEHHNMPVPVTKHCAKCFTDSSPFKPQNNLIGKVGGLASRHSGETQGVPDLLKHRLSNSQARTLYHIIILALFQTAYNRVLVLEGTTDINQNPTLF